MSVLKNLIKRLAHALLGDYTLNRIYYLDLTDPASQASDTPMDSLLIRTIESREEVLNTGGPEIGDHAWYYGEHSIGYGVWDNGQLVCTAWVWTPNHHDMPKRMSTLGPHEAALVDLLTASGHRGRGLAGILLGHATQDLYRLGYKRLWAWVWHNNRPSIRVFSKAGWRYVHEMVEFRLPGMRRYLYLKLPPLGKSPAASTARPS